MLLHSSTLHPVGPSSLAAIRFTSPVRVNRIRIFPYGALPFAQKPDIVSTTEPSLILLDVYFNAHPLPTSSELKQKASNALVPTSIAYAGGLRDFLVNIGEYSTRLMIIKGEFKALTLAIYGEVVSEIEILPTSYTPAPLPTPLPISPLSDSLNPAKLKDPTLLARQLLSQIPNAPPFLHLIRLMFCLKPGDEEWDNPNFPHVYADLLPCIESYEPSLEWLETAIQALSTPASDSISEDQLRDFADRLKDTLDAKNPEQSLLLAKLLARCACQPAPLTTTILETFDIMNLLDTEHPGLVDVLRNIHEAVASPTTARHLLDPARLERIIAIRDDHNSSRVVKVAAADLITRLQGWGTFEQGLSVEETDFTPCNVWVMDFAAHETTFGSFLLALISDSHIQPKLLAKPVDTVLSSPWTPGNSSTVNERIAFAKLYTGISSVFAVLSWADSEGKKSSVETITALIRLWQEVSVFSDIVNHILLLPQMIWRLECMIDADPPSQATLNAEKILSRVVLASPHALLRDRLAQSIATCEVLLSVPEQERIALVRLGDLARGGLSEAVRAIFTSADMLESFDNIREVRNIQVALKIIEKALGEDDGYIKVMKAVWDQQYQGFVPGLVEIFARISRHFLTHLSTYLYKFPESTSADMAFTAETLGSVIGVISKLIIVYPPPTRVIRALAVAIIDSFVAVNLAASYPGHIEQDHLSKSCLDLISTLTDTTVTGTNHKSVPVILRTLLHEGVISRGDDPIHRLSRISHLILTILPSSSDDRSQERLWIRFISDLLPEVHRFVRVLEPMDRSKFVLRLVELDQNELGVGEWLLIEDVKDIQTTIAKLDLSPALRLPVQYHVSATATYIIELIRRQSSPWVIQCLVNGPAIRLSQALSGALRHDIFTQPLFELSHHLAAQCGQPLRLPVALLLLRGARTQPKLLTSAYRLVLKLSNLMVPQEQQLSTEIGLALTAITKDPRGVSHGTHSKSVAESILALLELLGARDPPLANFTEPTYDSLYDLIAKVLPTSRTEGLPLLRTQLQFADDEPIVNAPVFEYDKKPIKLSVSELDGLLRHKKASGPSTPRSNYPQDIIGLVTLSPPTALLRSPLSTLTKTYKDNDFRQLRSVPSARQNTSRPPSMHVDDYELGRPVSPLLPAAPLLHHPSPSLPAIPTPLVFQSFHPNPPY